MEQPISDPHVSSCQEAEEMRVRAETAKIELLTQVMNAIVQQVVHHDQEIVNETRILKEECRKEKIMLATITGVRAVLDEHKVRDLKTLSQVVLQVDEMKAKRENLTKALQHTRAQKNATQFADPVYALLHEERYLQQQLQYIGMFGCLPSTSAMQI